MSEITNRRQRVALGALLGVFVVSRIAYAAAGVGFDTSIIPRGWQLLPQRLLRDDLVRSVWYLHSQPPLLNVIAGVAMHSPFGAKASLHALFFVAGALLVIVVDLIAIDLGAPRPVAFVAAAALAISPSTILYESWFFSTYPTAVFLLLSAWFLVRVVRQPSRGGAALFGASVAAVGLTRASYHLLWCIAAVVFAIVMVPRTARKRIAIAALVPVVAVAVVYVKNYVLFGEFTSSSWTGMNAAHMTLSNEPALVRADVARGRLSRQALIPPFSPVRAYHVPIPHTGVPALDRLAKGIYPNYNNRAYVTISKRYEADVRRFVTRHPGEYAALVGDAFRTAFVSSADYSWVHANEREIGRAVGVERFVLGQSRAVNPVTELFPAREAPGPRDVQWVVIIAYALVAVAASVLVVRALRRRGVPAPSDIALIYIGATVVYGITIGNLLELGENMRFRFETDPLVLVATVAIVTRVVRGARARRRALPTAVLDEPVATPISSPAYVP